MATFRFVSYIRYFYATIHGGATVILILAGEKAREQVMEGVTTRIEAFILVFSFTVHQAVRAVDEARSEFKYFNLQTKQEDRTGKRHKNRIFYLHLE